MSVQGGVEPLVKTLIEPYVSSLLIPKSVDTVPMTPILMASSLSYSEEAIHVSFIHFNVSKCLKFDCKVLFIICFCIVFKALTSL